MRDGRIRDHGLHVAPDMAIRATAATA